MIDLQNKLFYFVHLYEDEDANQMNKNINFIIIIIIE